MIELTTPPVSTSSATPPKVKKGEEVVVNTSKQLKSLENEKVGLKKVSLFGKEEEIKGKINVEKGVITTEEITAKRGSSIIFSVEFKSPIEAKDAKALTLNMKGNVSCFSESAHNPITYTVVVQVNGKELKKLYYNINHHEVALNNLRTKDGLTLHMNLPKDLKSIKKLEIAFFISGESITISKGFTISNIPLEKK